MVSPGALIDSCLTFFCLFLSAFVLFRLRDLLPILFFLASRDNGISFYSTMINWNRSVFAEYAPRVRNRWLYYCKAYPSRPLNISPLFAVSLRHVANEWLVDMRRREQMDSFHPDGLSLMRINHWRGTRRKWVIRRPVGCFCVDCACQRPSPPFCLFSFLYGGLLGLAKHNRLDKRGK